MLSVSSVGNVKMSAKEVLSMMILCDFDGTVTYKNVGLELMRRFNMGEVYDFEKAMVERGKVTRAMLSNNWANVVMPIDRMNDMIAMVSIRDGFKGFVDYAEAAGHTVVIASGGLVDYIKPILQSIGVDVSIFAGIGRVRNKVIHGASYSCDYKYELSQALRPDIYIGDGKTDIEPAKFAKRVYAIDDGDLSKVFYQNRILSFAQIFLDS
jgi:2-hydroxy-3-keto-5-methylthiopentenyl-1-phosphate phosphatase